MIYVTLKRESNYRYYWAKSGCDMSASILGSFLQEVGPDSDYYKEWINDPMPPIACNNLVCIDEEDGKVIMQMEWESEETAPSFVTSLDKFKSIIDQWEKLYAQMPNEIVVYKEGDHFTLKGKN